MTGSPVKRFSLDNPTAAGPIRWNFAEKKEWASRAFDREFDCAHESD